MQCDQLMQHNINRIARRTQRIRKVPDIGKKGDHKPASEEVQSSSLRVEPTLSQTCHVSGWSSQRSPQQLPPIH